MDNMVDFLDQFVKIFHEDFTFAIGEDWMVDWDNSIVYGAKDRADVDDYFMQNWYKTKIGRKLPMMHNITLSLMHEIGHIMTEDKMVDDTKQRNKIFASGKSALAKNEKYFRLYNERIATKWAQKFIRDNKKLMRKFDRKVEQMTE